MNPTNCFFIKNYKALAVLAFSTFVGLFVNIAEAQTKYQIYSAADLRAKIMEVSHDIATGKGKGPYVFDIKQNISLPANGTLPIIRGSSTTNGQSSCRRGGRS